MTGNGRAPGDSTDTAIPMEAPYAGLLGTTRMEAVHWAQRDGTIATVRVHTAVNATSDPALAERLITGNLNWVQLGGSDELELVPVPVVYHDEAARLFLLVLPDSYRARELAERAALWARLAEDPKSPVPAYVMRFRVVYADELALFLERRGAESDVAVGDETELDAREEAIVAREAKLAEWEDRLRAGQQELELDLKQREILDQAVDDAKAAELEKRVSDLGRRESELREVERHLMERQLEVERQEKTLQLRARKLERQGLGAAREVSGTDSPTRVADRESMELAARESAGLAGVDTSGLILEPRPEEDSGALDEGTSAADHELERGMGAAAEDAGAAQEPDLAAIEAELDAAGTPKRRSRKRRKRDTATTSLAQAVLSVTGEADEEGDDAGAAEASPEAGSAVGAETIPEQDEDLDAHQGGVDAAEEPPVLPAELAHWVETDAPAPVRYERDGRLHLAAVLPAERAELFVGLDPAAVFQLHELPTYPLLVIGLVAEEGEEMTELDPPAAFWPLDIQDPGDQAVMDRLAEDFRFVLEIYDEELYLVTASEVHFPLEENVRLVRERAQQWLGELELEPDLNAARSAFLNPEYRWLPVGGLPFGPQGFEELRSAADVAEALAAVGEWSAADKEDELILLRSYPASRWRRMVLEVLQKAIDFGLWMEKDLRRRALDAGYATSRKDLLRGCLAGFERTCLGEQPNALGAAAEHENWAALMAEAERLGIAADPSWEVLAGEAAERAARAEAEAGEEGHEGGAEEQEVDEADVEEVEEVDAQSGVDGEEEDGDEPDAEEVDADDFILDDEAEEGQSEDVGEGASLADGELQDLAPAELVALLANTPTRLEAALELCRRGEVQAAPKLFAAVEQMRKPEVIRLFPHLVGLGAQVTPQLRKSLRSGSTLVRQASALALGALGDEQAAEDLVELLLDEPTEIWTEVAQALGDLGPVVLMIVAAQIRHATGQQWERLSHAMAAISFESGQRDLLVDLSSSRDEDAATVARRALDILSERRLEEDGLDEELPPRDKPALFFSRRFFDARARAESELEEDDILEEEDIVENGDVMAEEPLPEAP